MPEKTPLHPLIHGTIERDGYTISKVAFESAPGFFVTGNLYRPVNPQGKVPGVLFAHGHWKDARLSEQPAEKLRAEIAAGEERFEQGGASAESAGVRGERKERERLLASQSASSIL